MPIIGQSPSQDLVAALHDLHPNLPAQTLSFLLPPPPTRRSRTRRTSHHYIDREADVRQHVPVKFEHRTEDGLWVKSECWDLHGQQLCQGTRDTDPPPNQLGEIATTSSSASSSSPSPSTSSASPTSTTPPSASPTTVAPPSATTTLNLANLPKGWKPAVARTHLYPIPIIVIGSVLVAAFIVGTIWFCGRARKRQRNGDKDIESRHRRKIKELEAWTEKEAQEDEVKGKRARWAKAKLRWRTNARISGKRRHPKRSPGTPNNEGDDGDVSSTTPQAVSPSRTSSISPISHNVPLAVPSHPPSRSPSPTPTPSIVVPEHPTESHSSSSTSPSASDSPSVLSASMPPAYRRRKPSPAVPVLPSDEDEEDDEAQPRYQAREHLNTDENNLDQEHPTHSAHVATDDKAALEMLQRMRSAPNEANGEGSSGFSDAVAPPEWVPGLDDVVEDDDTHGPRRTDQPGFDENITSTAGPSSGKARDVSDIPHTRALEGDNLFSPPPPLWLPEPPVHPSSSLVPGDVEEDDALQSMLTFPLTDRPTSVLPMYIPSLVEDEDGDNEIPSAPDFEDDDEAMGLAKASAPSAPPLDGFEDEGDLEDGQAPSAPPLSHDTP